MAQPTCRPGLYEALLERGMSRRTFLKFCSATAAVLALPAAFGGRIAAALEAAQRVPVVWLHGQACGGNTAAFLASASPTTAELLLSLLSVQYQEMLMAASGEGATTGLTARLGRDTGYLAVIEGAIPLGSDGMYCLVGGRPFVDVAREVTHDAVATIAVGTCAVDGGIAGTANGVSGATGVSHLGLGSTLVNLPGCPVNVENLAATIVHYLTFHELPPMGPGQRPLFAYGGLIHNQCERRAHFEFGEFATEWGDAGAQQGWCLYKLGCKGPESFGNCPTKRFAEGTSWPVGSGQGCIGCTMPRFWDTMLPAYKRLPSPIPFAPAVSADQVGAGLVGGVAALAAVHGVATYARARLSDRGAAPPAASDEPDGAAVESPLRDEGPAVGSPRDEGPAGDTSPTAEAGLEVRSSLLPGFPTGEAADGPLGAPGELAAGPAEEPGRDPGEGPAEGEEAGEEAGQVPEPVETAPQSQLEPGTELTIDRRATLPSVARGESAAEDAGDRPGELRDERSPAP